MNVYTGQIVEMDRLQAAERADFVQVKRDLSLREQAGRQIRKHSPCGCGSGKKFKFCCYKGH